MKKYFLFFFILNIGYSGQGQNLIAEILPDKSTVLKDIRGMTVDDGIFLTVNYVYEETKSYWIQADGTKYEVDLKQIEDQFLLAVTSVDDSTYYYYLEENKKSIAIKALVLNNQTGKGKISAQQIDLPGKLFGSHADHGNLYLLCALKGSYTLRLVHIQGMKVNNETNFPLSFDLGKNRKASVSYFRGGAMQTPTEASASIKLTKDKNAIWITIDEPMSDYDQTADESTLFKTSVIRLDLVTGETAIKVFFDPSHGYFNSTISNGHLFRVLRDNGFRMDVFNFETSKKIYTINIPVKSEYSNYIAYTRSGSKLAVSKELIVRQILKTPLPNFVIADSTSTNELILTLGNFGQTSTTVPVVSSFGVIGALISLASTAAIRELSEGPYFYQYFYLKGSVKEGFKLTNETSLIRQRIDDYEYMVKFKYKGYLSSESKVYAIYQMAKSIQILEFE